jgi:hypothetical protein
MQVTGYTKKPPGDDEERDREGIAKLDPAIRFVRVMCR